MNEKIGRQATIACYMMLGGVAALAMAMARANEEIMIAGICLSFLEV
jgi:putative MFS transporter